MERLERWRVENIAKHRDYELRRPRDWQVYDSIEGCPVFSAKTLDEVLWFLTHPQAEMRTYKEALGELKATLAKRFGFRKLTAEQKERVDSAAHEVIRRWHKNPGAGDTALTKLVAACCALRGRLFDKLLEIIDEQYEAPPQTTRDPETGVWMQGDEDSYVTEDKGVTVQKAGIVDLDFLDDGW